MSLWIKDMSLLMKDGNDGSFLLLLTKYRQGRIGPNDGGGGGGGGFLLLFLKKYRRGGIDLNDGGGGGGGGKVRIRTIFVG